MTPPFEGPPGQSEVPVRECPECDGTGEVNDNGKKLRCKRCNGAGQIRSGA